MKFALQGTSRRVAVEDARRYVTDLISLKQVKPGEHLPPATLLSRRIGVSRPVVLQALKLLAQEGRITVRPGRAGTVVLAPDGPERAARTAWLAQHREVILQMAYLRTMIEPGIARLAATRGLSKTRLSRAERLLRSMQGVTDEQVQRGLDAEFHTLISGAARTPLLHDLSVAARSWVAPAFDVIPWPEGKWPASTAEHRQLLAAVAVGEANRASDIALEHARASAGLIEQFFAQRARAPRPRGLLLPLGHEEAPATAERRRTTVAPVA